VTASSGRQGEGQVALLGGAMAAQAHLFEELSALLSAGAEDLRLLARPILVVVPSRSLREHLAARLVEQSGRALAGVEIQTLHTLVLSILDRAREPIAADEKLFPVLIRQLARCEPALCESLEALRNGYAAVEADVADLLDAGFQSAHAAAVIEQIGELSAAGQRRSQTRATQEQAGASHAERAAAVLRVAAAASDQLEAAGVGHRSAWVCRATELLEADPEGLLPARAVFVFGFADATGVQTDFIETLLRRRGARICIDQPPDPDEPTRPDPGIAFSARFSARLLAAASSSVLGVREASDSARVSVLRAPGREAEVRAVAERIRTLLDDGACPERIGVVARSFDGYRAILRVHFRRLGIPMSGVGERAPLGPLGRRVTSLQALLRAGPRAPVDLWLELLSALPPASGKTPERLSSTRRADLRFKLHEVGVARLAGVGGLPVNSLEGAVDGARGLVECLANWPVHGSLALHFDALRTLLSAHLHWGVDEIEALRAAIGDGSTRANF